MDYKSWIIPAMTIIGWMIIIVNTERNSNRSETRSICDNLIKRFEKLMEIISTPSKITDQNAIYSFENEVSILLNSIERDTDYLYKKNKMSVVTSDQIANFRSQIKSNPTNYDINEDIFDCIDNIEKVFFTRFNSNILFRIYKKAVNITPFWLRIALFLTLILSIYFKLASMFLYRNNIENKKHISETHCCTSKATNTEDKICILLNYK